MNSEIEGILFHEIFTENDVIAWDTYKTNIISNLRNIEFYNKIENYIPCERRLYVTRPKMREILYHAIVSNKNIFIEVGYNNYRSNITYEKIYEFIEECIKITSPIILSLKNSIQLSSVYSYLLIQMIKYSRFSSMNI